MLGVIGFIIYYFINKFDTIKNNAPSHPVANSQPRPVATYLKNNNETYI